MLELIEFFHVSSHRCRSRQSFGGAKEFCPNSPTLARKILDLQKKLFMSIRAPCDLQKKAVHVNSGAIVFKSKHIGRHFCPDFQGVLEDSQIFCSDLSGVCPVFTKSKLLGCGCTPNLLHLLHQCFVGNSG